MVATDDQGRLEVVASEVALAVLAVEWEVASAVAAQVEVGKQMSNREAR